MATEDLPVELRSISMEWANLKRSIVSRSPITGATETIELPAERWQVSLTFPPMSSDGSGLAEAFFSRVVGGVERVRLYDRNRPVPMGTMRGSPTLATAAARGDRVLNINTTGTLRAGDRFKVGNQLFQAFADAAPSGGVLTVKVVQRVREALASGAAVSWDRPTALFILPATSNRVVFSGGVMQSMTHDFDEVFS